MKTCLSHTPPHRANQAGSAVIVMLAMLAVMALLVASNTRTINVLRTEVHLVDQRQTARLAAGAATLEHKTGTNTTAEPTP